MSNTLVTDVLTFGHILGAIGWLGGALVSASVLGPVLGKVSGPTRKELLTHLFPRFGRMVAGSATLTLIFGISLYVDLAMAGADSTWMMTIGVGILLAIVAYIIGVGLILPPTLRLPKLAEGWDPSGPPTPELGAAIGRIKTLSLVTMLLLLGTLAFMVGAAGVA